MMKRIVLTERDNKIIDFLNEYKCATTSTIANIFFNGSKRPCSRRLKLLKDNGFIKSTRDYVQTEYVFYISNKPKQIYHSCKLTEFLSKIYKLDIEILKSKCEYKIGNVRSDCLLVCRINNKIHIYLIEVCNTKPFDEKKYIRLKDSRQWKEYFPIFPSIIVISNKEIKSKYLDIININLNLDNFKL